MKRDSFLGNVPEGPTRNITVNGTVDEAGLKANNGYMPKGSLGTVSVGRSPKKER